MDAPLAIDGLSKYYGSVMGVKDVSLTLDQGEVFGFLGPNGAGKTTTIRTIMDFIRPSHGSVSVFGMDSVTDSLLIKPRVGYLAGDIALYPDMSGAQLLRYLAVLGQQTDWEYVDNLAARLEAPLQRPFKDLSKGNRQKIGLIQAFMHRPELLVLDEPTSGLDPLMQRVFYELVEDVRSEGRTMFLSSHNLQEVQRLCDRAAFIRDGKLMGVESISDMRALNLRHYTVRFGSRVPAAELREVDGVSELAVDTWDNNVAHVTISGSVETFIRSLHSYEVVDLSEDGTDLEDVFMHYYEGQG